MDASDETRKVEGPKTSHKFLVSFEPITTFDGDDDVDDETMIKSDTKRKLSPVSNAPRWPKCELS